jgi:hypothetical protein
VLEAFPAPVSLLYGPDVVSLSTISVGTLAAVVLASHKADPIAGGRLTHPHRPHRLAAATAPPSCSPTNHQMPEASMFGLSPCGSVPFSPASRHSEDGSSLARNCCPAGAGGCGGCTRHPSYAEVVSLPPSSQPGGAGCEKDATMGWRGVPSRCRSRRSAMSESALMPRPLPAWFRGICCRCLFPGHHAVACRDPIRCSRCL